jgi:adenosylcobinamide-GDP ribazoletransferase
MNKINQYILGLKFVFSYFTVLPVNFKKEDDLSSKNVLNSMLFFLPFLGFVLGCIVIFLYGFLENLSWFGALICACIYMMLYGFIHTEAILDVVDAIYAKHSGKDAYEVIKDPTVGAMGVLYAIVLVVLKLASITFLLLNNLFFEFISVLIISRLMLIHLIYFSTFKSSFIYYLKNAVSFNCLLFSSIFSFIMIFVLVGTKVFTIISLAFLLAFLISRFIKRNVGFLNGDALGTTLELIEIILFIIVCSLWLQ